MSRADFFTADARMKVRDAVVAVEALTSAELVVSVRRRAATYREADYLAGSICAFVALLFLLFHPYEVPVAAMPVQVLVAFAFGAFAASGFWVLKRLLTRRATMEHAVALTAKSIFVDRGITRTTGRNGILVLVSLLEKRVELVADHGVDTEALGAPFENALVAVRAAISQDMGLDAFVTALKQLGPPLGAVMPRSADDVNELPDDPVHE